MLGVIVKGGTNAGRRIIRKKPQAWVHVCPGFFGGKYLDASFKRCPSCGRKRPTS